MSAVVDAMYATRCADCGGAIVPGQQIVRAGSAWVHRACPPGRMDLARAVCESCWTEFSVSGSCLCGVAG